MIGDEDIRHHAPPAGNWDWAETGYFNFYIPEANIFGFVYIVHRAGVGVTITDVEIVDRAGFVPEDSLYIDLVNHQPLVERAEDFTTANGLSFRATSIRDYVIGYRSGEVELHLECISIMEPYDIHDPAMDPMADPDMASAIANSGFGAAYTAHFDMSVAMTGQLRMEDHRFVIDCVSTMDHSWGPRPETGIHPILWLNAHFDRENALHAIFAVDRSAPSGRQHVFKHGYALVDGRVRGATAGAVTAHRPELFPAAMDVSITDCDGAEHRISGAVLARHRWTPYGNNVTANTMARWHRADGRSGIGTYMEAFPLNRLRPLGSPAREAGERLAAIACRLEQAG